VARRRVNAKNNCLLRHIAQHTARLLLG